MAFHLLPVFSGLLILRVTLSKSFATVAYAVTVCEKKKAKVDFSWKKPKEYLNSNDMMCCFLRTGFVWVRRVNNSRNFDPRRTLGDKCRGQLAEPSKELL